MSENNNQHEFGKLMEKFKEHDMENLEKTLIRRNKDGSIYRNRHEILEQYKKSYLPYPIAPLLKLDYCRKMFFSHLQNSFYFAGPLSLISLYVLHNDIRKIGYRTKSFSYILSHYLLVSFIIMGILTLDCLAFSDYCKPWSQIYNLENDSEYFKKELMTKFKKEIEKPDVKLERTKDIGLKDDEL